MGNFNSFKNDRSGGDRGFGGGGRSYGDRDRGSRPSYGGGRDSGSRSSYGGRSDGPKKMFPATCDSCNQQCEVPFRPSGTQPVYCSNCFKSQKGGDSFSSRKPERSFDKNFGGASTSAPQSGGLSQKQLDSLHLKMDKIISLLESGKKAPLFEKSAKKEDVVVESTQGGSVVGGEKSKAKKKVAEKAEKKAEKKEKKEKKTEKKVAKKAAVKKEAPAKKKAVAKKKK